MINVFDSGTSRPGTSPGRGHCVVFLSKTPYSHGAFLYPFFPLDGLASHPGRNTNPPNRFMLQKPG